MRARIVCAAIASARDAPLQALAESIGFRPLAPQARDLLGLLDARAGRSAQAELKLPRIHLRKEIATYEWKHD
jgi:hypothetical protein